MITVICDACEKPFEVGDDRAGAKVPCPACGDVKVIPGHAGSAGTAAGNRAAAVGLPPATGPEAEVLRLHSAVLRARPIAAVSVMVLIAAGLVGTLIFGISAPTWGMAILCAAGVLGGLIILLAWKLQSWSTRLLVTNKRVVFTRGILSKATVEMLHRTIQDIEIRQTFLERLLNVGSINIANASEDDDAIVITSVKDPYRVRKAIDAYRPM